MSDITVGILSPGDMGAAIGHVLRDGGLNVIACLQDRGTLTRQRASEAGIREVATYDEFVSQAGLILSVLVPAEASAAAEGVATAIRRTGARPVYADCNAISPASTSRVGRIVTEAGAAGFIDAGII